MNTISTAGPSAFTLKAVESARKYLATPSADVAQADSYFSAIANSSEATPAERVYADSANRAVDKLRQSCGLHQKHIAALVSQALTSLAAGIPGALGGPISLLAQAALPAVEPETRYDHRELQAALALASGLQHSTSPSDREIGQLVGRTEVTMAGWNPLYKTHLGYQMARSALQVAGQGHEQPVTGLVQWASSLYPVQVPLTVLEWDQDKFLREPFAYVPSVLGLAQQISLRLRQLLPEGELARGLVDAALRPSEGKGAMDLYRTYNATFQQLKQLDAD